MSEIDIRNNLCAEPTYIRFANESDYDTKATRLSHDYGRVYIQEDDSEAKEIRIMDNKDALNLIKALEKAIELNWFD